MKIKYESQKRGVDKYVKEHYYKVFLKYRKDDDTVPLLERAILKYKTTKVDYIKKALQNQFKIDGITADMILGDEEKNNDSKNSSSILKPYFIYKGYMCERIISKSNEVLYGCEKEICYTTSLLEARKMIQRRIGRIKNEKSNTMYYIKGWEVEARNKIEAYENHKDEEFLEEPSFFEEVQ